MDIRLNSEQLQLQDSIAKFLATEYAFDARLRHGKSERGWSEDVWRGLGELGLMGIGVPEAQGGFGGGASDFLPVMFEMGRALVIEPFFASAVWSTSVLAAAPASTLRDDLLVRAADGSCVLAYAAPTMPGWALHADATNAGGTWSLRGIAQQVIHGVGAHRLIVAARMDAHAVGLFVVDASAPGLQRRGYRLADQTGAADLSFEGVPATLLVAPSDAATQAMERATRLATAALCAEAAGAVQGAFDVTVGYLKTRTQFGRSLGENQVVRHHVADMRVWTELCESLAYLAAIAVDAPDSVDPVRDLARAKLLIGRYGRQACECALHLHGGIGMTDEYIVGHYLQRVVTCDGLMGDQDAQLDRLLEAAA